MCPSENRKEVERMLWLTDWAVLGRQYDLLIKQVSKKLTSLHGSASTQQFEQWIEETTLQICFGHQLFFKRHDCFLTWICALNPLSVLRNFLYRFWKHNDAEMKNSFRINDGDRTEVASMLKFQNLKVLFSTYFWMCMWLPLFVVSVSK